MNNFYLILSGLILGVIVYQTMFVAPTVFQTIDSENTSKFLRKIFLDFFIFIFTLSILAALEAYYNSRGNTFYIIYLITSLFSLIAFSLIPMTNKQQIITISINLKYFIALAFYLLFLF